MLAAGATLEIAPVRVNPVRFICGGHTAANFF
jgi:hypothetical protein